MIAGGSPTTRSPRPLDAEKLRAIALHYVGRYATTQHRLKQYLQRKIRERGWSDSVPPDPDQLCADFAALGYVNDESFADMRTAALLRRGYGPQRIRANLRGAGINAPQIESCVAHSEPQSLEAATALARRKRFGPFDSGDAGRKARQKAYASLARAGHAHDIIQTVLAALDEEAHDDSTSPM